MARESAISRSPIQLERQCFCFSNWVEPEEGDRDHLIHKVWIKLHNWPILCWNTEDVQAAVSSFGALWEVDDNSLSLREVSFFHIQIRCRHYRSIPETLLLYVEDRRFSVRVEIDSWEDADPILLGEALDRRLGLDSAEAQVNFIRSTGFSASPLSGGARGARVNHGGGAPASMLRRGSGEWRPVCPSDQGVAPVSNLDLLDFPPLPSYSGGCQGASAVVCGASDLSTPVPTSGSVDPTLDQQLGAGPAFEAEGWASVGPPLLALQASDPLFLAELTSLLGALPLVSPPIGPLEDSPSGVGLLLAPSSNISRQDRSAPANLLSHRRSLRLAHKYKGNTLPSIKRAQVLRCKLLAADSASTKRTTTSRSVPAVASTSASPAPQPPLAPPSTQVHPPGIPNGRDLASPLSEEEVAVIKANCGIKDAHAGSPPEPACFVLACPAPGSSEGV